MSGMSAKCPRCDVAILVPHAKPLLPNPRANITESGVMRVLGDAIPNSTPAVPQESQRTCPRCQKNLSAQVTVCGRCNLYLGVFVAKPVDNPLGADFSLL